MGPDFRSVKATLFSMISKSRQTPVRKQHCRSFRRFVDQGSPRSADHLRSLTVRAAIWKGRARSSMAFALVFKSARSSLRAD